MFYLVIHLVGTNGHVVMVENRDGDMVRAEFTTRADAEMARGIVIAYDKKTPWLAVCVEESVE